MKFLDLIKDVNKNLMRSKSRSFLTILSIVIGSFAIITTVAMNNGINKFIDDQFNAYGGKGYLIITKASNNSDITINPAMRSNKLKEYSETSTESGLEKISDEDIENIKKVSGIDQNSIKRKKNFTVDYVVSDKKDTKYLITLQETPPGDFTFTMETGREVNPNSKDPEVTIPSDYVRDFGYESNEDAVNSYLTFTVINKFTSEKNDITAKIVGIAAKGVITQGQSYANDALINKIYSAETKDLPKSILENYEYPLVIYASYDYQNYDQQQIKDGLKNFRLQASTVDDLMGQIHSFFNVITIALTIFGVIALFVATIGIANTLLMSVQERTREIGLDKAMGMSSNWVFITFASEAATLGFWGSAIGTILSAIAGNILNDYYHGPGQILESFTTFNVFSYEWSSIIVVILLIMAISFIAGTMPAIKAAHKNPIDALRYE